MRLPWIWVILLLVVNAPQAGARTVTGYKSGQKTRIQLVEVSGVELEAATARAFRTMAKAARKVGIEIGIRSGFRSHEKQKQLYRDYKRGWGHLAAKPGYSNHQNGKALDIYIDDKRTVKREAWHWEYVGGKTAQARKKR
jgi:D-alanyl-D-alanine carboxypeptidase